MAIFSDIRKHPDNIGDLIMEYPARPNDHTYEQKRPNPNERGETEKLHLAGARRCRRNGRKLWKEFRQQQGPPPRADASILDDLALKNSSRCLLRRSRSASCSSMRRDIRFSSAAPEYGAACPTSSRRFSLTAAIRSSIAAMFGKISVREVSSVSMFRQNMCDGSSER
jgi:hypothetical protein